MRGEDLTDLCDKIDHCSTKVSFIGGFMANRNKGGGFVLSEREVSGIYFILADVEDQLDSISEKIMQNVIQASEVDYRNALLATGAAMEKLIPKEDLITEKKETEE